MFHTGIFQGRDRRFSGYNLLKTVRVTGYVFTGKGKSRPDRLTGFQRGTFCFRKGIYHRPGMGRKV